MPICLKVKLGFYVLHGCQEHIYSTYLVDFIRLVIIIKKAKFAVKQINGIILNECFASVGFNKSRKTIHAQSLYALKKTISVALYNCKSEMSAHNGFPRKD